MTLYKVRLVFIDYRNIQHMFSKDSNLPKGEGIAIVIFFLRPVWKYFTHIGNLEGTDYLIGIYVLLNLKEDILILILKNGQCNLRSCFLFAFDIWPWMRICLIATKQNGYTRHSEDLKGRFYNFYNLTQIRVWIGSSTRETKLLKGFLSDLNCLFVWVFSSHSRIFYSYGDVTFAVDWLQNFDLC